jgi:hypothetical protein
MSERLEQWKARERIRSDIGWVSIWVGIAAVILVGASVATFFGYAVAQVGGKRVPGLLGGALGLALGLALLVCARGLWNARSWARWASVLLFVGWMASGVAAFLEDRTINIALPFQLFVIVYLLLPSTGARFARAAGLRDA